MQINEIAGSSNEQVLYIEQKYNEAMERIQRSIQFLQSSLEEHNRNNPKNWGRVGDLDQVERLLIELIDFIEK